MHMNLTKANTLIDKITVHIQMKRGTNKQKSDMDTE